jgi:hypothetical protein
VEARGEAPAIIFGCQGLYIWMGHDGNEFEFQIHGSWKGAGLNCGGGVDDVLAGKDEGGDDGVAGLALAFAEKSTKENN